MLRETKGSFKLKGKLVGLGSEFAFRTGESGTEQYRSVKIGVKTSKDNTVNVTLFGMTGGEITVIQSTTKEQRAAGKTGDKKKLPFSERRNVPKGYFPVGNFAKIKTSVGQTAPDNVHNYDAVNVIQNEFSDDETVYISGNIRYNTYTNKDGNTVKQRELIIGSIFKEKDIDFDDAKFEELCSFNQDIIVKEVETDDDAKKTLLYAFTVDYSGKYEETEFVIDDTNTRFLANIKKRFKFGDTAKVVGVVLNKPIIDDTVDEEEEDEFGGYVPKGQSKQNIKGWISEFRITGVVPNSYNEKVYSESDFISDDPFDGSAKVEFDEDDDPFA